MILKTWGKPWRNWKVTFFFRFGRCLCAVENYCAERNDVALLLRRFRKARYWAPSKAYKRASAAWAIPVPPAHVLAEDVPRFGLRWLALHWCVVVVEGRRNPFQRDPEHAFATAVPRPLRPTKVPFLRWFERPFRQELSLAERYVAEVEV